MLFGDRMTKGYILSTPTISAAINSNTERNMWEAGTPISPQRLTFLSALEALTLLLLLSLFAIALHLSRMTEWNCCIIHPLSVGQSKLYWEMLEATKLSEDGRFRNSECAAILVTFHAQNVPEFFCFMFSLSLLNLNHPFLLTWTFLLHHKYTVNVKHIIHMYLLKLNDQTY